LCLYFMGSNLSNSQIARKLDLNKDDVQAMALQLREGSVEHKPAARLEGIVECDEVYIVNGDGFHEIHVNTMEGFWSLLRSWLRPYRGISQEHLPLYLGFFEFVHNAKNRSIGLMDSLLGLLLR